jgi:hypothetical protein
MVRAAIDAAVVAVAIAVVIAVVIANVKDRSRRATFRSSASLSTSRAISICAKRGTASFA